LELVTNSKKGKQIDYVLGDWDEAENSTPERLELASEIIKFGTAGLENTMTTFNGK
jgi:PTH1 family peptidyl-tRNA hydrolase